MQQKEISKKWYLNVPYSEKDQAKELGAKWDAKKCLWYFYESEFLDPEDFDCWWRDDDNEPVDKEPTPIPINLKGKEYFIIEDALALFIKHTDKEIHPTNLGNILARMKIKRLGYIESGASAYPADCWNEFWSKLLTFANKQRKMKIDCKITPAAPLKKGYVYKTKAFIIYTHTQGSD